MNTKNAATLWLSQLSVLQRSQCGATRLTDAGLNPKKDMSSHLSLWLCLVGKILAAPSEADRKVLFGNKLKKSHHKIDPNFRAGVHRTRRSAPTSSTTRRKKNLSLVSAEPVPFPGPGPARESRPCRRRAPFEGSSRSRPSRLPPVSRHRRPPKLPSLPEKFQPLRPLPGGIFLRGRCR